MFLRCFQVSQGSFRTSTNENMVANGAEVRWVPERLEAIYPEPRRPLPSMQSEERKTRLYNPWSPLRIRTAEQPDQKNTAKQTKRQFKAIVSLSSYILAFDSRSHILTAVPSTISPYIVALARHPHTVELTESFRRQTTLPD